MRTSALAKLGVIWVNDIGGQQDSVATALISKGDVHEVRT